MADELFLVFLGIVGLIVLASIVRRATHRVRRHDSWWAGGHGSSHSGGGGWSSCGGGGSFCGGGSSCGGGGGGCGGGGS